MTGFRDRWEPFGVWISRRADDSGKSSMWQRLMPEFDIRQWPGDASDRLFRPGGLRGYGLFARRYDSLGLRARRRFLELTYWLSRAAGAGRNRIWQFNVSGLGVEHLAFHPAAGRWLGELGLSEGFQRFCDRFDLSPHSAAGIKACYVASLLQPYLATPAQRRVIEIGGGLGNVAAIAHFQTPLFQYVVVDLPEMMLHSSLALQTYYPEMPCYFLYPGSPDTYQRDAAGFYFCTPDSTDVLGDSIFDVGYNIDSFQEMTAAQVAGYLRLMQRVLRAGAHFVNLNRRKYLEAEQYDNNPLLYPYAAGNRVVRWETDLFMDRTFNFDRVRLDGWMLRVEQITK